MTERPPAIAVLLRLLGDRFLAGHVLNALRRYEPVLDVYEVDVPGFGDLASLVAQVARSGQLRPLDGSRCDGRPSYGYLLPARDAAALLGVSERTLRRRVTSGSVPAVRVGRRRLFDPIEMLEAVAGASAKGA